MPLFFLWITFPLAHNPVENPVFNNFLQKIDFPLFFNNPHPSFHTFEENFSSSFQNPPVSTFSPHVCRTLFQVSKGIVRFFHMSTFTTTNTTLLFLSFSILKSPPLRSPLPARFGRKTFKRVEKQLPQVSARYTESISSSGTLCRNIHLDT